MDMKRELSIGVVTIDLELTNRITAYPIEQIYSLSKISEKENLSDLDGLIIPIDKKNQLSKVIDWILASQKVPNQFIWVFSNEEVETEEDILRKLGVNEVIEGKEHLPRLFLSIENIVNKVAFGSNKEMVGNREFLDTRNQGICIDGGGFVGLTRIEYSILAALEKELNNVISYEELMSIGWPKDPTGSKLRLANMIFHLRKKVEVNQNFTITNVRSKGYMLST